MASSSAPQDKPNTKPKRAYTKNKYTLSGPDTSGSASSSSVASSQPRIRAASSDSRTKWQKIEDILKIVSKDFGSIGDFLETLFHARSRSAKDVGIDPRSATQQVAVTRLLQGSSNVHMSHIIRVIHIHPQSQPPPSSEERELMFSSSVPLDNIHHARPALSAWAAQLVGNQVYAEINNLTHDDP